LTIDLFWIGIGVALIYFVYKLALSKSLPVSFTSTAQFLWIWSLIKIGFVLMVFGLMALLSGFGATTVTTDENFGILNILLIVFAVLDIFLFSPYSAYLLKTSHNFDTAKWKSRNLILGTPLFALTFIHLFI